MDEPFASVDAQIRAGLESVAAQVQGRARPEWDRRHCYLKEQRLDGVRILAYSLLNASLIVC
jgi:hypothetical protein